LRPLARQVDTARLAVDDVAVDGVLDIGLAARRAGTEDARSVGLVVREKQLGAGRSVQVTRAEGGAIRGGRPEVGAGMPRVRAPPARPGSAAANDRLGARDWPPRPRVAEPQVRQDVQGRRVGTAVERLDLDDEVLRVDFRILDEDVEVAIIVENARIEQLELETLTGTTRVLLHQPRIGKVPLWILVEEFHVGVGRGVIEVEVVLLDILAVIALVGGQSEQSFLEDGVLRVPEGGGEAEQLITVADASNPVLAPAIGLGAGEVMRQVAPGVPAVAVVLANRCPGAVADIRSPVAPSQHIVADRLESLLLDGTHGG